jgi:hypothetical protein
MVLSSAYKIAQQTHTAAKEATTGSTNSGHYHYDMIIGPHQIRNAEHFAHLVFADTS